MRILKDERGNILVLTALSLTGLMSCLALSVDVGNAYYAQRQLQTLADTAAMAGALEITSCAGSNNCNLMQTAATSAMTESGASAALSTQCGAASASGLNLTLNNPPCALGASDPNSGLSNYVEAVVSKTVPSYFAGILGFPTFQVSARAEAGYAVAAGGAGGNTCMNTPSLTLNSGSSITDATGSTCGVNDNSAGTLYLNSGVTVNVGSFTDVGTDHCNSCSNINPMPTTGTSVVPDPYSGLAPPTQPTNTISTSTISTGTTLGPGYYPNTLNFNSGTYTVTLSPGLYWFGGGWNVNGNVTVQGTGVTLYFAGGAVNMNSAANFQATAPTGAITNCASCAGILIWQPSGNLTLDSASTSSWGGAVYVPNGELTLNGGSNAGAYGYVYAQSIMLNSGISLSCASMPGGVCPGGAPAPLNGTAIVSLAE